MSIRPSPYRMLMVFSPVLLFLVVPRIVIGGDVVLGRTGWEIFGLCALFLPFLVARFSVMVVGEQGIAVRRALRTRRLGWDEIGTVAVESRNVHLVLVLERRSTGRAEAALTFVSKPDRRRLIETIASRVPAEVVRQDDILLRALTSSQR
ncbi:PH domain-containing protein [Streptomyces sp. NPDC005374]|uniref:PH domain-containing protein n=1 Tax=Streptomyces sp. NPDC005374 TaxID=3364713 RepID=UPI003688D634